MSHPSDERLLALHGLRLSGFSPADRVATRFGLDPTTVDRHLAAAAADGLVRHRDGRIAGWVLTADGRAAGAELLAAELDAAGARDLVYDGYRRFLQHNVSMLALCTDWQVRDGDAAQLNDHDDPGYDAAVVDRLVALHAEAEPIWADLGGILARFASYEPRFAAALAKVQAGEADWFTKPLIDSYHTIWFELHEDLLATLGIERSTEAATAGGSR